MQHQVNVFLESDAWVGLHMQHVVVAANTRLVLYCSGGRDTQIMLIILGSCVYSSLTVAFFDSRQ